MGSPRSTVARRLIRTMISLIAVIGAVTTTGMPVDATVFRDILSGSRPASPPFVVSPNFMTLGPGGATITFTTTVTNLTTSPQTVTLTFGVHHILTYYGLSVGDGQPGLPGITFKPGDADHTTQQLVGTAQVVTVTFPPAASGPTTLTFHQTVGICGYFQADVGQHKTGTLPQANLSAGFTRVLGCQTLATPTLTTSPNPTSATVGTTLNDTASLSGGSNPTGTIKFTLFDPSNVAAYSETINVTSGNHAYSTATGHVAGVVGIWHWKAEYSGDANNKAVASNASDEPVTVTSTAGPGGGTGGVLANTGYTPFADVLAVLLIGFGGLVFATGFAWRRRIS